MKLRYKNGQTTFQAYNEKGEPIPALLANGYLIAEPDANGNLTHLLDGKGARQYTLVTKDDRVLAVDAEGTACFELDAGGFPRFELGTAGNRIALLNDRGDRTCRVAISDDNRLLAVNGNDVPLYELDEQGRYIYLLDKQGQRERSFNPMEDQLDRFRPEDRPVRIFDEAKNPILPRPPPYYLSRRQHFKMAERPEMLIQYAHFLADTLRQLGYKNVDIRSESFCSLNGREPQRLVDSRVNLATVKRSLGPANWIVPLDPNSEPGVLYKRELARREAAK